jgi:hypothetical protein
VATMMILWVFIIVYALIFFAVTLTYLFLNR